MVSQLQQGILPSQIIAHEGLYSMLMPQKSPMIGQASKSKRLLPKTTTTTKPPIVWFPGEPDCNESDSPGFVDSFQMIAFLLSVFNIASAMVSNANNNNNNNNLNDNKFNGNENDINEGNANAGVEAMNMIGMGRKLSLEKRASLSNESSGGLATVVMSFMHQFMKIAAANSKDCQRLLMCQVNKELASRSIRDWQLSEICSLGIARRFSKSDTDFKQLLLAANYGRIGLDCMQIYDDCGAHELRFIEYARILSWSPVGELRHVENLVSWMWSK